MNLTAPHPPKPATTTDTDHYAVQHNPNACTMCGLPVTHPIHTVTGTVLDVGEYPTSGRAARQAEYDIWLGPIHTTGGTK